MLFSVFIFMCAVDLSRSKNFNVRCNNDTERLGMTFQPVGGEFLGRYTVELCTEVDPNYTEWETRIYYYPNVTLCPTTINLMMKRKMKMHSRNVEYTMFDSNCTNVCLTKEFDLIFSGCYTVETRFLNGENWPRFKAYNFNVTSLFDINQIKANRPTFFAVNHDDELTVTWHPGVPPTDYQGYMCDVSDQSGTEQRCARVACRQPEWRAVSCSVRAPRRCVTFVLRHRAPWASGPFHPQELAPQEYCPAGAGAGAVGVSASNWSVTSWALALGALAALGVLAQRLWFDRRGEHFKKLVLKTWQIVADRRNNRGTDAIAEQIEPMKSSRTILLVYARENVAGQRVVDAFKAILEHYTDGQVLDPFSARVARVAAPAPAEWVRRVAAAGDVTLLLLQTPALHLLCPQQQQQQHEALAVSAPLFPARLVPRVPMFGDSLVQLVLRMLSATDLAHAYNRLYIATLSELPIELFPHVVPYRRYVLPRDAALLARDAAAPPPGPAPAPGPAPGPAPAPPPALEALLAAHRAYVDVVKDNPTYLMDELMLIREDTVS